MQEADKFVVRLPKGWRDTIRAEAHKSHRSMNAEIVAAIETAMRIKGVSLETREAPGVTTRPTLLMNPPTK